MGEGGVEIEIGGGKNLTPASFCRIALIQLICVAFLLRSQIHGTTKARHLKLRGGACSTRIARTKEKARYMGVCGVRGG